MALFLSPARRCLVEDAPVYYPFGGKLSRDALQNYYGPQKEIDILFLSCYDLRNVLFTIASKNIGHGVHLNVHLNNNCPLSFARNVLVVKVFSAPNFNADAAGDIEYLWDLWYNAVWPKSTLDRFVVDVRDLIENGLPKCCFSMESSHIDELKEIFNGWLLSLKTCLTKPTQVTRILKERSQYISGCGNENDRKGFLSLFGIMKEKPTEIFDRLATWRELAMETDDFPKSLKEKLYKEVRAYYETGNCNSSKISKSAAFNPTLLEPKTFQWRVYSPSCPLDGYLPLPLNELEVTANEGIATRYCQKILKNLVTSFKQLKEKVQIHFRYSDDLQFGLQEMSAKFDIIDCSFLADEVGLANLILSTTPKLCLHPNALLITESIGWCEVAPTVEKYVEESLCAPCSMIPTIYGLRLTNHVELGSPTLHERDTPAGWPPVTLIWRPSHRFENVTLGYSSSLQSYLKKLQIKCNFREDETRIHLLSSKENCGINRYTPMTFNLALKRLGQLTGKQEISNVTGMFKVDTAPQFVVARKTLEAYADGQPVKLVVSSQPFTPVLARLFAENKILYPSPKLRIILVPAQHYVQEKMKLYQAESPEDYKIDWAATIPEVHYIDNFYLYYRRNEDGSIRLAQVFFLLPETHNLTQTHMAALVDMFSGITQMFLGAIKDVHQETYVNPQPISRQPSPKVVLLEPNLEVVNCEESEKEYVVDVSIKYCEDEPKGLSISTDQALPCEVGHSVTLTLAQPEKVKPLALRFPYPILIDCIGATLRRTDRTIRLVLKKGLLEPWPCNFSEKPKWKVDSLGKWKEPKVEDGSVSRLMLHLTGMKDSSSLQSSWDYLFESKLSQLSALEIVRNAIGSIFAYCEGGQENFIVFGGKNDKPQWYVRAHLPFRVTPFGSPMVLLSVLDQNLSEKLVKKGHIQAKQAQEDLTRIFEQKRQKKSLPIPVLSEDSAHLLRYVFRLNSTKMTPSTWQEENLPLGKYSPYLATYVSPLYLDNQFPENDELNFNKEKQERLNLKRCRTPSMNLGTPEKESQSSGHCAGCGKKASGKLKRCSRCKIKFYCSVECQRTDWKKHKSVCSSSEICVGCKETSDKLKRCSKCKLV